MDNEINENITEKPNTNRSELETLCNIAASRIFGLNIQDLPLLLIPITQLTPVTPKPDLEGMCIYPFIIVYIHIYVCIYLYISMNIYINMCMYINTKTYLCMYIKTYIYTYI
jgi:hypothetical protein